MKIIVEHCDVDENQIIIRCNELDDECLQLLSLLNLREKKLIVWQELGEMIFIRPEDVLYFESIDDKTFAYTLKEVYQTKLCLSELVAKYEDMGYLRISKNTVLNLYQADSLRSCRGSKIEIKMKNGEKLIASRHFAPSIRQSLDI